MRFVGITPTRDQLIALEAAEPQQRGMQYYLWAANRINSLFETFGVKGQDGRGAAPSDIRPETIRHGESVVS